MATIVELLRLQAEEQPGKWAYSFLIDGEDEKIQIGYAELDLRARAIAARLQEIVRPGDRVLLLLPSDLEFVVAFFGCLYAGVVAVPAYPPRSQRSIPRLLTIVGDATPTVTLTTSAILSRSRAWTSEAAGMRDLQWLVIDDPGAKPVSDLAGRWRDPGADPDRLAFLQYTSGSTAAPKGVMVSHQNLLHNQEAIRCAFGQSESSVIVGWLPLFHDMGLIGNVLQPLYIGASCVLMSPAAFLQKPLRWLRAIDRYRATTSGGPNFAYELCRQRISPEQRAGLDLSCWKVAFNGAEPVRAETLDGFAAAFAPHGFRREAFYPCYGLAEATLFVSGGEIDQGPAVGRFAASSLAAGRGEEAGNGEAERRLVGCGRAWMGQRITIVDPEARIELPPGGVGEIWVAGPSVTAGYWNQPEATARDFGQRLADGTAEETFLNTGDLGFQSGGQLFVTGRLKDLVILRGRNHYPQDFEATAEASHPDLLSGGAGAFTAEAEGEERLVIVAEVNRRREAALDAEAVAGAVRQTIAETHEVRVHEVVLIRAGTLLKTSSGKVRRRACRAAYLDGDLTVIGRSRSEDEAVAPDETVGESLPAEIGLLPADQRRPALISWLRYAAAAACRVAPASFSTAAPLTSLGLDSLGSAALQHQVETAFGVELELVELLGGASVTALADRILEGMAEVGAALAPERKEDEPGGLGLGIGQQALWFLDRLAPDSTVYNLASAASIHGDLDPAVLDLALARLAERHPALRTTFSAVDGRPRQRVEPAFAPDFVVVDAAWNRRELGERLDEEARRPFDLESGPPARWRLFVHSAEESILLLTIHHLVSDFWSIVVLLRDLEALYLGHSASALSPAPATYADYLRWQERRLSGEAGERLWKFWELALPLPLPVLELPSDRPRSPVQSFRGGSETVVIPPGVLADLHRLARAHDVTPFMVLLGLFQVLLHRASGQEDVLVGTPTSGRAVAAFSDLVGYCVNPIVLRAGFADDPSFAGHLAAARPGVLAAYAHQDYPFARLAERLQPERDPGRPPVFQALFTLQKAQETGLERLAGFALGESGERMDWAGLELEAIRLGWRPAPFDLSLAVAETAGALRCSLQFCADLFDATTARRLLERFAILARAAAATPELRVGSLPWLSEGERAQLLAEWNDTASPPAAEELVHRLVERQVSRTPDRVAVVCRGESLTYREINARANQMACHLLALGLTPEGRVGVCLDRSHDMVVALLGVLKAGGAYVPLDPTYPRERLALILEDASIDLLITEERRAATFGPRVRVVSPDGDREAVRRRRDSDLPRAGDLAGSLAYVIYTSGSTGRPKGVMVGHRNVVSFCSAMDRRLGEEPGCWLAVTSVSFDISVLELLWTLSRGYRVVVRASDSRLTAAAGAAERPIDFSLFFFAGDAGSGQRGRGRYRLLLEAAKRADPLGFSAIWTPERHFHTFGGLYPNPSVIGAALATLTERVAIRAGSVVLPLHNPVRVAEEWSVVDNLSDGRVGIAFASGWNAADFVFAPERFVTRKETMLEQIEVVRRLWRGEAVRMPGGAGEVEVRVLPRPVQAELPVWITAAGSPDTFRLAGELGANLLTHLLGQSLRDIEEKIAVYRRAWREAGHPGEGQVSLMLHTFVGESVEGVRMTVRGPLTRYLATSLDLMKVLAPGQDFAGLSGEDQRALLDRAFDRYFETSGLFGTVDSCRDRIRELQAIGVDEIACLIDFGIETDDVLESLERLASLREASQPRDLAAEVEETILTQIARHGVTHFQCTPSALTALGLDPETPAALSRLRRLLVGGEALPPALAGRAAGWLSGELLNMYGPTETTVWSAVDRIDGREGVTIGRPIANTGLHVVDGWEALPLGQPGELLIGGEGVAFGYWRRPDLTAERFVPDPFSCRPGARLYRTGDQVRRQSDGRLVFLGRLDHQVKIRGHRIELGEIESALAQHPAVREAVVVAREETPGDLASMRLVAYVVPAAASADAVRPAALPDPERLERALAGHDRHRLPNGLVVAHLSAEQTSAIYREIFEQEIYLMHGIGLPEEPCIFDVGANIGLFTLFALSHRPKASIYSFEPIPPTFAVLSANADLYGQSARVFPLGLSDREEEAELTFYPRMAGLSGRFASDDEEVTRSIVRTWLESTPGNGAAGLPDEEVSRAVADLLQAERHPCRLRPLSALIHELGVERIDLLKIDVEKSELRVLQGVNDEDWPKIGQIVIEVHTRELLDAISPLLAGRGYELTVDEFIPTGEVGKFVWMLYAARPGWAPAAPALEPPAPALAVPELRSFLQRTLPAFLWPAAYVVLGRLPLTPNGKVDRRALPAPAAARSDLAAHLPPETALQQAIAEVWRELLPVDRVGIRDNFFELGGNSLLLVEVHGRLRRALGREIPLRALLRGQTIETLAGNLESLWRDGGPAAAALPLRPVPRERHAPLSFAQERLWFLQRLAPDSSVLNVANAFRLRGALDIAALAVSFAEICRRHEILRTRIEETNGTAWQEVLAPALPFPLTIDLGGLAIPERELQRLADAEAARPFDLSAGGLLRVLLLRLGEREHVLVVTLHHIGIDAWSLEIFFRELAEIYEGCLRGSLPRYPALPIQYADYAVWQRRWTSSERADPELSFWRRQLAALPAPPLLPGQRERAARPRFRGAVHRFELSPELSGALGKLARAEAGSLFMTLLAAFSALIHQYTGLEDLLIATNVANRNPAETVGLIGYFVNTLALRPDLSGDPTFRQLLVRVREMTLAAYTHQEVPFEKVLAAVQPRRQGSHSPLFRVMFVMQTILPSVWCLPGLETAPFELGHHTANFDLMVLMAEGENGLLGAFLFDTDLFEAAAVVRMAAQFEGLLAGVAADADQALSSLDLEEDPASLLLADQFNEGPSL